MKKLMVAVALLIPAIASAQVSIDGTWKIDAATAKFPEKPDKYEIKDGRYTCSTCVPTYRRQGGWHRPAGHRIRSTATRSP